MSTLSLMILIDPDAANSSGLKKHKAALKMRELRGFLTRAKSAVGLHGEVSILLASDATIRTLNRDYRKKDKATDVLSFPVDTFHVDAPKQAGDLAISLDTAQRQAEEHGHSLQVEVKILMLHGLLHLAGYDHETDKGQMARREIALRKEFDLPAGLIQRTTTSRGRKR
ncbi:MAG TPA: rRNA maturation RNase YbeY [Alloacidobacterium sp.]|jgi:probable rRNA maturation factor|nr:rRNA maturation RNase YbeY [Alloacidobacterium sp.]